MIEHNFKKKFGQNFLQDKNIIRKIVDVASPTDKDLIIEIGPGSGALTEVLTERARTISYEIDTELKDILEEKFGNNDNSTIIYDDFLNRNVKKDIENYEYEKLDIEKMVLMVQKEVGDRFTSKEGTKEYSSITVYLNYYFDLKKEFIVTKNAFYPRPNVDSMIISLSRKKEYLKPHNEELFLKLVRDSFQFKRKTLKNNLREYNWDSIKSYLDENGIKETVRAEELKLSDYIKISDIL